MSINLVDALVMRAEYCEGHISYNEMIKQMPEQQLVPVLREIADVCGGVTRWIDDPETAMYESLLTAAVITHNDSEPEFMADLADTYQGATNEAV